MKIKITADSTCDLSAELLARYDITTISLTVIKAGQAYRDGVDIQPQDIFSHVDQGGALCSTSAVNAEDYRFFFEKWIKEYDAVIHINIGSGFSSCYQNATIAAANFTNVHVVDSMNLSTGQGLLVIEAAQMARDGMNALEICSRLNAIRGRVQASFILDRLDYMQKGGRCSAVVALGGKLLKIKPCIAVREGSMGMVEKYRGNFAKSVEKYVKDILKDRKDIRTDRVFITHTPVDDEAVQAAREAVEKYGEFKEVLETSAGCTVSCHCGPGTLGVLFLCK
ncbi:MAG: DegV family protein [Clostridiales bacterium]|nr:DegV family protein [Clostridiales bacterium]